MIGWIAAKPKRVMYLALTVISILVGVIEDSVASTSMRIVIGIPVIVIGSLLVLLALGALYEKEDWDEDK